MALYTILFGISIFMIALVIAIIKKMFFRWQEDQKIEIERSTVATVQRPAVSTMIFIEKCLFKKQSFSADVVIYTVVTKSDLSFTTNFTVTEPTPQEELCPSPKMNNPDNSNKTIT